MPARPADALAADDHGPRRRVGVVEVRQEIRFDLLGRSGRPGTEVGEKIADLAFAQDVDRLGRVRALACE